MTKEIIENKLKELGLKYNKIKFFDESPYEKNRYKDPQWEAWIYNGLSDCGLMVNKEMWENQEYLKEYLQCNL